MLMKRFLIKIIIFILPILVLAFSLEIALRNIPNDYQYKNAYLDKHSNEIETLILGSSHTFYGLNPEEFTSQTFNASYISQSIDIDYAILQKYQDDFQNLQSVILPISYFSLFENLENTDEFWRLKNYTLYFGLDSAKTWTNYSEIFTNSLKTNAKRIYSYYIKDKSEITCNRLGWGTAYRSENAQNLIETGKSAAKRHTVENLDSEEVQEILKQNIATLQAIISWCEQNNVKIYLITPPAYTSYRENLHDQQLAITLNMTTKICSENSNCQYFRLLDDEIFSADDFYDGDHLSEIGAKKLSKIIHRQIQE